MKEFWKKTDKLILGSVSILFSLIIGTLYYIFDKNTMVPFWIISIIIIFAYLYLIVIYAVFSSNKNASFIEDYKVVKKIKRDERLYLIIKPNKELTLNTACSIYHISNSIENHIGLGFVNNVQKDGKISVEFYNIKIDESTYDSIKEKDIIIKTKLSFNDINCIGG